MFYFALAAIWIIGLVAVTLLKAPEGASPVLLAFCIFVCAMWALALTVRLRHLCTEVVQERIVLTPTSLRYAAVPTKRNGSVTI